MRGAHVVLVALAAAAFAGTPAAADEAPRPSFSVSGTYYQDSDRNRRHDETVSASVPAGAFSIAAEGVSHAAHDALGDPASQQGLVGVEARIPWDLDVQAMAGAMRFSGDTEAAGRLVAKRGGSWGEAEARLEYAPLSETAAMIRHHVRYAGLELAAKAHLHERFRPGLRTLLRDYSDDNRSLRLRGDLPVAVVLHPLRWEVGYRQEYATFERQSGGGYFDPSRLHSFQAVSSLSFGSERVEGYGEFFGGLQQSRRYGNSNSDGFYGLYVEAAVSPLPPLRIALTAEGGDYSLGSAGGFRHVQGGLEISYRP